MHFLVSLCIFRFLAEAEVLQIYTKKKKENVLFGTVPTLLQEGIIKNLTGKLILLRFFLSICNKIRVLFALLKYLILTGQRLIQISDLIKLRRK